MIQFESQFLHSFNDKVFEVLYGVNAGNEGLSFVYIHFELCGSLQVFHQLSPNLSFIHPNSHGKIMGLLLVLNNAII
jgi:hypothetical protein